MRLGFNTFAMPNLRLEETLRGLAEIGFRNVEITVQPGWDSDLDALDPARRRDIRTLCDDLGLGLVALTHGTKMASPDPTEWVASWQRLARTVDLAVDWAEKDGGPPIPYTSTGGKPGHWEQMKHALVDRYGAWADYAAARGVKVALEPHIYHTVDTVERALWMLGQVNRPNFTLCFDISHLDIQGYPTEEAVSALAPFASLGHLKDQVGTIPRHEFVTPGDGEFDYARYLRAMHQIGYEGPITAMISVMAQRKPGYDAIAAARQSHRVLTQAFRDAGVPLD
jgi:sugar phosphate isomerase/epimerase